ncbi:hypothetical protein ACIQV2_27800 [Streptomyces globosus]|uniref:hypothetical protein n=1 Tax=Streptomyces globosus TaxID=68209 RepID=UPI00380306B1
MRVIRASLDGPRPRPGPGPEAEGALAVLSDLIWAHARASHGLEHVRARPSDAGVDLYLFLRAASEAAALDQARALLSGARAPLRAHGYATSPQTPAPGPRTKDQGTQ